MRVHGKKEQITVYDAEKNRMDTEISAVVGITRSRDAKLETVAEERAFEIREQVGLTYDGPQDIPVHPTAAERRARLGVPDSVGTAELATWNYLYRDPVGAAISGLLNSTPHRLVLNNPIYTHWGFGIYTEMPEGSTSELERRWYFSIWLTTQSVDSAALATPDQTFDSPKYVHFGAGTHWGYKFGYDGRILNTKKLVLTKSSRADAKGRGQIIGRDGDWLLMNNGYFENFWVSEYGFYANVNQEQLT